MITYHYESNFLLQNSQEYTDWIIRVHLAEKKELGALNYIFCNDLYLSEINLKYLHHNTLTDIITFDYATVGEISGDIFISTERVEENAMMFEVSFEEELKRVMVHGVLHLMGYDDKTTPQKEVMRNKENELIKLFHVEL
ncbi:MAG: rRNA maturation RNase YbeY [Allomuricauda sp.]|nr:MAG: rRNA maturation RNase YbeY [Allomuricauda sp.]